MSVCVATRCELNLNLAPSSYTQDIIEDDSDDEYDDKEYCICRGRDDGTFMICCDSCNEWYHGRCVHITARKAKEIDKWICEFCIKKGYRA